MSLPALLLPASGCHDDLDRSPAYRSDRRPDSPALRPGFFQQVVWSVGHLGQWTSSFHQGSFLGLHFSPILVVPALIERLIWADVRVLSLIHSIAVGALGPAAFLFLRAILRPSRAAGPLAAASRLACPRRGHSRRSFALTSTPRPSAWSSRCSPRGQDSWVDRADYGSSPCSRSRRARISRTQSDSSGSSSQCGAGAVSVVTVGSSCWSPGSGPSSCSGC